MKNWNIRDMNIGVANGAEIDLAVSEDFSKNDLVTFLRKFSDEEKEIGGNIVTGEFFAKIYISTSKNPVLPNPLRLHSACW